MEIAESFFNGSLYLDLCANRYYYSLYQMADAYALKCLKRNIYKELEEKRGRRKSEKSSARIPTSHFAMEGVIREFIGDNRKDLLKNFKILKSLRHTADYYPSPVNKEQLIGCKDKAIELFKMLENAIEKKERE